MVALLPIIRAVLELAPPSGMPSVIVYGFSLLVGTLSVTPVFLLLLPNPSRTKVVIAIIVFVLYELFGIASLAILFYVRQTHLVHEQAWTTTRSVWSVGSRFIAAAFV
jgi:hypothetical protein